jgi:hypothetical protein
MNSGEIEKRRGKVDVDDGLDGRRRPLHPGPPDDERDLGVDVERERLSFDEAELAAATL